MMVEDRESKGLPLLEKSVEEIISAAGSQSGLRNLNTTFSARSPQLYLDIDRTQALYLKLPLADVFSTLQAYLGSTLCQSFQ